MHRILCNHNKTSMYRNTAFVTSSAVIVPSMDSFSNCSIRSFCVTFSPPALYQPMFHTVIIDPSSATCPQWSVAIAFNFSDAFSMATPVPLPGTSQRHYFHPRMPVPQTDRNHNTSTPLQYPFLSRPLQDNINCPVPPGSDLSSMNTIQDR